MNVDIENKRKPDQILFYNSTKGGVDTMDKLCHAFFFSNVGNLQKALHHDRVQRMRFILTKTHIYNNSPHGTTYTVLHRGDWNIIMNTALMI